MAQADKMQSDVKYFIEQPYYRFRGSFAGYMWITDQNWNILGYVKPNSRGRPKELCRVYTSPYKKGHREVLRIHRRGTPESPVVMVYDTVKGPHLGTFRAQKQDRSGTLWRIYKKDKLIGRVYLWQGTHYIELYQKPCGHFIIYTADAPDGPIQIDGWWLMSDPRYDRRFLLAALACIGNNAVESQDAVRYKIEIEGGGG